MARIAKMKKFLGPSSSPEGHSPKVFVIKMAQRCGVWQIKPMTSLDPDLLSTKSNNSGFGGYSQMKIYKGCKIGTKLDILVWFGFGNTIHDFLVDGNPKNSSVQLKCTF